MELKRWCQDWWWILWAGNPRRLVRKLGFQEEGERALEELLTRDGAVHHLLSVFEMWRREDEVHNRLDVDFGIPGHNKACTRAYCRAIEGLTKLKAPQAVGALIPLLDDPDIAVRANAIQALGDIGDPRASDPLIPFLGDRMVGLIGCAATALRKLGETKTVEMIERVLRHDASALVWLKENRLLAVKLNALVRALNGFDQCAANAAWALGSLGEFELLVQALDGPNPAGINAARELGNLGRVEALPELRRKAALLSGTRAELKTTCREAIAKLEKLAALPRRASSPSDDLDNLPRPAIGMNVDPVTLPRANGE